MAVGQITEHESGTSRQARKDENWEPGWIHGRFVAVPECQGCGGRVVVTGEFEVDTAVTSDGRWYGDYDSYYRVRATCPGLRMTDLPEGTPPPIRALVDEASAVLWASPPSAAGSLRRAVEVMLDDLKVNKTKVSRNGKRERLTTHARIVRLKQEKPDVADALMAVKWVGNDGSHEANALTVEQVLDIADVFSYALGLVYDTRGKIIRRMIARVNRAKKAL